jgi:hypothetical protein
MLKGLSVVAVAPRSDIRHTTQSIEDWPKLEMILPASSGSPLRETFCSAIGNTFTGTPEPPSTNRDQRANQ